MRNRGTVNIILLLCTTTELHGERVYRRRKEKEETKKTRVLSNIILCAGNVSLKYYIIYKYWSGPPLPERQLQTAMTFAVRTYIYIYIT